MSDASHAKWLHDGKALCAPTNAVRPMNATRDAGLPESSVRGTPDQYEEINLGSVARCVRALGGAVQVNVPEVKRPELGTSLTAQPQTERPKRWADLSDGAADVGSASTEHQNLDREAAEQELLEKTQDTWPHMPREIFETLHAEPGQETWTALVTAWRCWIAEQAEEKLSSDKQLSGSARQKRR